MSNPSPIDHCLLPAALDRLIASAPPTANLATGSIGPLVAWRLKETGRDVPDYLDRHPEGGAYAAVTGPWLLQRIRAVVDGPIVVLKGPEVAAHYPFPALRPYGDLDLLVEDVAAAEGALVEAGFTLSGSEESVIPGYIHDRPLRYEHLPLAIELHRSPGWLSWMTPPSNAELFAMAVPSATGVHGITTMPVAAHALFLAVHSWRHGPYHSLLHLVDIDLMRRNATEPEIGALAAEWGMSNLWSRTTVTIDWLLYDAPPPGHLDRYWTRHLTKWRPRTTREYYLATRTKGIAAEHVPAKARAIGSDIWDSFALRPGESPISVARYMWRKLTAGNAPASTSARRR